MVQTNGVHVNGDVPVEVMERDALTGIDVLVVGAGLGGLVAAIELYRQGHQVRMIEGKKDLEGLGNVTYCEQLGISAANKC